MRNLFFYLVSWCPGAFGLFLRQKIYPFFLGSCGRKVLFGRFIRFHGARAIHIGDHSIISDKVILDGRGGSGDAPVISIGRQVFIGANSRLRSRGEKIVVGMGSSLGSFCVIAARCPVIIEENVLFAAFCRLGPVPKSKRHRVADNSSMLQRKRKPQEIVVGKGCWLGVRSYVLPGVRVGSGTVVGAHALVLDSLPENVVAVGRPAQVIRER